MLSTIFKRQKGRVASNEEERTLFRRDIQMNEKRQERKLCFESAKNMKVKRKSEEKDE